MDGCVLLTSTPSCVVSPRGDPSGCALGIARRGETTHSGVDVNNTHPSMINPLTNILRPRRNEQHFADDIFKRIFFNENVFFDQNVWISIKISLKFVPKGPINKIPALVHIMAWRRSGDKPLSEPMMVSLPTHICVTPPQWVNTSNNSSTLLLEHVCYLKINHFRSRYIITHVYVYSSGDKFHILVLYTFFVLLYNSAY